MIGTRSKQLAVNWSVDADGRRQSTSAAFAVIMWELGAYRSDVGEWTAVPTLRIRYCVVSVPLRVRVRVSDVGVHGECSLMWYNSEQVEWLSTDEWALADSRVNRDVRYWYARDGVCAGRLACKQRCALLIRARRCVCARSRVWSRVRASVRVCVRAGMHVCACVFERLTVCACASPHVYTHAWTRVLWVCSCVRAYVLMCMFACLCVCMCVICRCYNDT